MEVKKVLRKHSEFGDDTVRDLKTLLDAKDKYSNAVQIIRQLCVIVTSTKSPYSRSQLEGLRNICVCSCQVIIENKVGDVLEVDTPLTAAMYHIARVILEMGDYESFVETTGAITDILECMPANSDTKQLSVLTQLSVLVYMSFKNLQGNLSKEGHINVESKLLQLWELMLRVSNLSWQGLLTVLPLAQNIIVFYSKTIGLAKNVISFQNKIMQGLKLLFTKSKTEELQDSDLSKLFKQSLSTALVCFQVFTSMKDYDNAVTVLKDMIKILNSVFPVSSPESEAIVTFEMVLNPFLFSFNTIPLTGPSSSEIHKAAKLLQEGLIDSTVELTAFNLSKVLSQLKYYWLENIEKAKDVFPLSVIPPIEEFFSKLATIVAKGCSSSCSNASGQQCALKADLPNAFFVEHALICLATQVVHWDAKSQPLLTKICEESCDRMEQFLRTAMDNNCFQSTKMAFYLCESMYNASGRASPGDYVVSKKFLERSNAVYLLVSKTTEEAFIPRKSIARNIQRHLINVLRNLKETSSACRAAALAIALEPQLLQPQHSDTYLPWTWSGLVAESADEDVSLLTLLKSINELELYFADYSKDTLNWADLFVWEMAALESHGRHRLGVLLKSWGTRKQLSLSPLQKIKSAASFLGAVAFCDDLTAVNDFVSGFKTEEYHDLLKKISSRDRPAALCGLAEISYSQFVVANRVRHASSEKLVDTAKVFEPLPKVVLSATDVVNKNDACDLTPTFPNLTLSKEVPLFTLLDSALSCWDESLKLGLEASLLSSREQEKLAQHAAEAAMFCRLCGHYLKEKRAWEVCRSLGERLGNNQLLLRAISGLMDLCCCDLAWMQRGQNLVATLEKEPTAKEVVHVFKHSNVIQCLQNGKEEEASALLKEILQSEETWSWYYIRSKFLLGRCLFDTPGSKRVRLFPEESESPLAIVRHCFLRAKLVIESKVTGSSRQGYRSGEIERYGLAEVYYSACLWLGYAYAEMMLPREARCFLKCALPFTQKFGLSVRTAECVSLLGKVDLLVQKVEDGAVKVEAMKQILEVDSSDKEEPAIEVPIYQDGEQVLRMPPRAGGGNDLGSSPTLPIASFSSPHFLSHRSSCSCYYCCHLLLQKLWLDMCCLHASVCALQFQVKPATNFFCNGMRLAGKYRHKQEKLLVECGGYPTLLEDFHRSEMTLQLKYADLLTLYSKDTEAWKVNEKVIVSLNKLQMHDSLLLTDTEEQKITLIDISNPQTLSQDVEPQLGMRASLSHGSIADYTPDGPVTKRPISFLTAKTPAPAHRQREGSRTPLKAITPHSVVPVKEKCFIAPRGVVPPVLIFSDSDDDSPLAQISANQMKASRSNLSRTTKENGACRSKSAAEKKKLRHLRPPEDVSEPEDSFSALPKGVKTAAKSKTKETSKTKKLPRAKNKHIELSDSVDVIEKTDSDDIKDRLNTAFRTPNNRDSRTCNVKVSLHEPDESVLIVNEIKKSIPRAKKESADKPGTSSIRSTRARKLV